jgi:beta-glucanase (GH16 family)
MPGPEALLVDRRGPRQGAPRGVWSRVRSWRVQIFLAAVLVVVAVVVARAFVIGSPPAAIGCMAQAAEAGGSAVCEDQFTGPAGSSPDSSVWTAAVGAGGWGNGEIQKYTASSAYLDGKSHLVIEARRTVAADGTSHWTSGRVTTQGKTSFTTGTLSARIQLPDGQGLLPAFWLMGDSVTSVGWPQCGEIDIVETPNSTLTSYSTIHGPGVQSPLAQEVAGTSVKHAVPLSAGFHVYSISRSPGHITTYIDGAVTGDVTRTTAPKQMAWVFDQPFHVIFSLAVGGSWPGNPNQSTPNVNKMVIDWVRYTPTVADPSK